jgi:photosystem II stability/assembly factor-like uncharacterized protein
MYRNLLRRWQGHLVCAVFASLFAGGAMLPHPVVALQDESASPVQTLLDSFSYRSIGPFRGGRAAACTGVPGKPMTFFFGSTGGGVWRTDDGGSNWQNISDGFFGGSIGAVQVAPSDPNVIYVGGGEVTVRGNVSSGDGMWKSVDGGKTWEHIGLEDSRHIPRIRIHPRNPDIVYAAALGHLYGPNQQRGVYRSTDGGKSWERVLFVSGEAGAVDLVMDPANPRILYASTWQVKRTPYSLESGGPGSGLWKSTDGGDTWKDISRAKGLPGNSILGIIGVSISPVDSNRIWAIVEAGDGGLFRSDDGGESWSRVSEDRNLRQRAWYYSRVYADPKNVDRVYVVNVQFWRSDDGGRNFSSIRTPHGDHHDLWIDPDEPQRMIICDDGGAQVTFDGGSNWSTYLNQPTAQFYRVVTDNHFPYRIYGAQQDNSTVRIASRSDGGSIGERDWEPSAGGESGHMAPHPDNPEIVYGGSYGGYLARRNHETGETRDVNVWPDNPIGRPISEVKYRFQWNFPIFFSPHDSGTLYAAANVLFKSTDEGRSWQAISPDLTRNDASKQGASGGPITKDNTGVEVYCTIFAAAESPLERGVLWTGSDDGLIHVSRDAGANWENVTPPQLPEWSQINSLEVHPTIPGGLYIAATRYKLDDFKPYLLKTTDYGQTWTMINNGIDPAHFTRVVRADPGREGLLYAGTESGMYISLDDGANWRSFQLNLPLVPVTDLTIKDDDLIVATQGRSFWILDDLTLLHQWDDKLVKQAAHLFQTRPVYRGSRGRGRSSLTAGANPPGGVQLRFWLRDVPDDAVVSIRITDSADRMIEAWSTRPDKTLDERELKLQSGMNSQTWDMRYPESETFDGIVLWGGGTDGPEAIPGMYKATLAVGEQLLETEFEIKSDPRLSVTAEEYQQQFDFLSGIRDKLTETHKAIKRIRNVRGQLESFRQRLGDAADRKPLVEQADSIIRHMTEIEETLYQTKSQSSQDPLNFPIRLNNRLSALVGVVASADGAPTRQAIEVHDLVVAEINQNLAELQKLFDEDVAAFNNAVKAANVPVIFVNDE